MIPRNSIRKRWITFIITALLSLSILPLISTNGSSEPVIPDEGPKSFTDLDFDGLEKAGYRPRFSHQGDQFIQTPEPMPDDAVLYQEGGTSLSSSTPTRATWDTYYEDHILIVYVDISSSGGGDLSSNEEQLLDRIISDFVNFSFPRVKDYFDPMNRVSDVEFYVHQIDGYSGVGGYYQPGTDEFHVDRADLSWAGPITAHEFQHYVHRQYDPYENLWIDEGCADYGAYLVYGLSSVTASHVRAYLEYRSHYGLVVSDNTFIQDGTTAYYGIAFLFQLYLTHQYGGKNWTNALVRQTRRGTSGVTSALSALSTGKDFQDVFAEWMVATRFNDGNLGNGQYEYGEKTYPYGSINIGIRKSHSGTPVSGDMEINGHSVTVLRFSSPDQGWDDYRLEVSYSQGEPYIAMYQEEVGNTQVEFLHNGGGSLVYDFSGWGDSYSSFQLVMSSTSYSTISYKVDIHDMDPPITTLSVSPRIPDGENGWYVSPPLVTLEASERSGDTYYTMDGGPKTTYGSPFYVTDGVHNISFWSDDRHGNVEERSFFNIKVDTVTPTSSIEVDPKIPEDQWYSSPPQVTLGTNDGQSEIMYKFNNDDYITYSGAFYPPEGKGVLYWKAVDQAGNEEERQTRTFLVDTIPPHLSYSVFPEEPNGENGWYVSNPDVTLGSTDSEAIYYALNSRELQLYSDPISIPEGETELRFLCIDKAGNRGNETRLDFKVDSIEPEIEGMFDAFEYSAENSSEWHNIPPMLEITPSEEDMTINYSINGDPTEEYVSKFEIPEGENEIWVYGKDKAGNEASPLFYLVKVDKRVPSVEHSFTTESENGWFKSPDSSIELTTSGEDDRSSMVKIYYRWGPEDEKLYRGPMKIPEGINTITYWATDQAGNEMEPRRIEVKKDSILPMIYLSIEGDDDGVLVEGNNLTVDISGSSDEGGIVAYAFDFDGSGPKWENTNIMEHTYTEPGNYTIYVYVKDSAGNVAKESYSLKVVEAEQDGVDQEEENGSLLLVLVIVAGSLLILLVAAAAVLLVVIKGRKENAAVHRSP
ncbi:MAG: PKD domain-containing protein [Thermoplasmatota archaeon]